MNELASEFFYTGIAYVPPGLLVIALYWRNEVVNAFQLDVSLALLSLFIVCILAIAYLVGIVVDALTFYPYYYLHLHKELKKKAKDAAEKTEPARVQPKAMVGKANQTKTDEELARDLRRQIYFVGALITMSRGLCAIFSIAWVLAWFPTWLPTCLKWPTDSENYFSNGYLFAGGVVFFVVWRHEKAIKEIAENEKNKV